MMQLAADELGPSLVRVNSIRPGPDPHRSGGAVFMSPEVSGGLCGGHPAAEAG